MIGKSESNHKSWTLDKGIYCILSSIGINAQKRKKLNNEITEIMVNQTGMKKPIYYGDLCRKISSLDLNPNDQLLHEFLGEISNESDKADQDMLSVFAISRDTGMPGKGILSSAKELG